MLDALLVICKKTKTKTKKLLGKAAVIIFCALLTDNENLESCCVDSPVINRFCLSRSSKENYPSKNFRFDLMVSRLQHTHPTLFAIPGRRCPAVLGGWGGRWAAGSNAG